jgi:hypothetical protein
METKKSAMTVSWILAAAAASLLACGGGTKTSSSSNWLTCETDADCDSVRGLCSSEKICVDSSGSPIEAPGSSTDSATDSDTDDNATGDGVDGSSTRDDTADTDDTPPADDNVPDDDVPDDDVPDDDVPDDDVPDDDVPDDSTSEDTTGEDTNGDGGPVDDTNDDADDASEPPADDSAPDDEPTSPDAGAEQPAPIDPADPADAGAPAACLELGAACTDAACCEGFVCNDESSLCVEQSELPEPDQQACTLPLETGPCRASMPAFGFDTETGGCVGFTYGGCQGNDNRFESLEACQGICGDSPVAPQELCSQPPDAGMCLAAFERYYYDPDTGMCQDFVWGGCDGNDNNFETLEACQAACP